MDFKHKSSMPNSANYVENIYRSPYNESMLHHINTSPKEQQYYHQQQQQQLQQQPQHMSVYEYDNNHAQQQQHRQSIFAKSNYQHRSPNSSLRLRRRCRSECLSPLRSPHYQYINSARNDQPQTNSNNGYRPDSWRIQNRRSDDHDQSDHHHQQQQNHHRQYSHHNNGDFKNDIQGIDGYKYQFSNYSNLHVDGKSVQLESLESNDPYDYLSWHERRRLRARSESASQDYYYRENYFEDLQESRAKRTRELMLLKEKRLSSVRNHHNVTNPKNNVSVLVNNSNHCRYSPKAKIRSHKVGLVRVSSPLHKARLQMWKNQNQNQNSGSSSIHSTESTSNGEVNSPQNEDLDEDLNSDDSDDDDDDDEPIPPPGHQIIDDDDMTDPEDNYETSLSLSSSDRSSALNSNKNLAINTDCVHGGRVLQAPLAPSLFPFVPPFISFATFEEKGPEMPAVIHKILKWKLTTITPLLVRKVLLNTGFRLMKSK